MKSGALPRALANFAGFQATWFACVGGAGAGYPILGPLVAALWLSLHLASIGAGRPEARGCELKLLIAAMLVGYAFDSVLVLAGGIAFPAHAGPAGPTTPWMVALWAGFAATLRHSLDWARRRYVLGLVAGAGFGPLAYAAGEALGAITLAESPVGGLAVAVEWALAMPVLLWLRERIERAAGEVSDHTGTRSAAEGRR